MAEPTEATKPTIFISHRHDDEPIAKRLQAALESLLDDRVRIFNTSAAGAEGVPAGWNLNDALRRALNDCSIVILLYTRDDADWRWCFYECGVANDPSDRTPTRTVVLDFGTDRGSVVFDGDKHLTIVDDPDRGAAAPNDFRQFIRDLVVTDQYLSADVRPASPPDEAQLFTAADGLYEDLLEVGPVAQTRLTEELVKALTSVPAADRKHFQPLFEDATKALRWGLEGTSGVRDLFISYWNERLLNELESMAERRLVFPPGRVYLRWGELLAVCLDTYRAAPRLIERRVRPVLSLVSHEAGVIGDRRADSMEFWARAQTPGSDPWFYEKPVRKLALGLQELAPDASASPPLVERVFVIDRRTVEARAAQLADVANWMARSNMVASIAFEDQRNKSDLEDFSDFGIIGDIAVSRFAADDDARASSDADEPASPDPTSYRSLVEDFDTVRIQQAADAWSRLQGSVEWRADLSSECTADELIKALTGST